MPFRPSMRRLLLAARVQQELEALRAVDQSARASVQEARVRARLYENSSFAAVFNNRRHK